jgi:hypothetical protein
MCGINLNKQWTVDSGQWSVNRNQKISGKHRPQVTDNWGLLCQQLMRCMTRLLVR